jgi:hypothetical protein
MCARRAPSSHGKSVWEIGAQRHRIGAKAQEDYVKRSANPLGVNPSEACFFFFTPQRWPQKEVWAAERKAEGVWRDVRVIDSDNLVNWLDLYPGVAEWLAVRINRRPKGLRNLGEIWKEWSLATIPFLSPALILADRDDQAISVLRWLKDAESVRVCGYSGTSRPAKAAKAPYVFFWVGLVRHVGPVLINPWGELTRRNPW